MLQSEGRCQKLLNNIRMYKNIPFQRIFRWLLQTPCSFPSSGTGPRRKLWRANILHRLRGFMLCVSPPEYAFNYLHSGVFFKYRYPLIEMFAECLQSFFLQDHQRFRLLLPRVPLLLYDGAECSLPRIFL